MSVVELRETSGQIGCSFDASMYIDIIPFVFNRIRLDCDRIVSLTVRIDLAWSTVQTS